MDIIFLLIAPILLVKKIFGEFAFNQHSGTHDMYGIKGAFTNSGSGKSRAIWITGDQENSLDGSLKLNSLTASKVVFTDASKVLTSTGIGTSSQFIKGDGSLDSSTYLTTTTAGTTYLKLDGSNILLLETLK